MRSFGKKIWAYECGINGLLLTGYLLLVMVATIFTSGITISVRIIFHIGIIVGLSPLLIRIVAKIRVHKSNERKNYLIRILLFVIPFFS